MTNFEKKWNVYLHEKYVEPQKEWENKEFDFIMKILNRSIFPKIQSIKNPKILDVGCGSGYLIYLLIKEGYDTYGITYKKEERDYSLTNNHDITNNITVGDMHDLPYQDNFFDIVISRQSLEHSLSPIVVLWEIHRVLKRSNETSSTQSYALFHVPFNINGIEDGTNPTHHYAYTPFQWLSFIELNGFKITEYGQDKEFGGLYIVSKRKDSIPFIR